MMSEANERIVDPAAPVEAADHAETSSAQAVDHTAGKTSVNEADHAETSSAEAADHAGKPAAKAQASVADGGARSARTYTADEVRAMVQSESDRRVTGARSRWERDLEERVEAEAAARAARLAESDAKRIAELECELAAERERSERRERRLAIASALEAAGLSGELIPLVEGVAPGAEDAAIAAVRSAVDERAAAECARRVVSKPPVAGEAKRALTAEEIAVTPIARLAELMR